MKFELARSMLILILALLLFICGLSSFASAACYDLSKSEPKTLVGHLKLQTFAGPPNYEDVRKGDTPERVFILKLDKSICLTGDDFADPAKFFDEVHVVRSDNIGNRMRAFVDSYVTVNLSQPMAAETGHHHRPLVAWVTKIGRALAQTK
ncbi:MAG: hypothetical protein ABJA10_03870 [Aestuariivirga sp.]